MANTGQVTVKAIWDNEAKVWVAESDDVPGLVTEAESSEALLEKLRVLIPELLEANHCLLVGEKLTMNVLIQYHREDRTVLQVAA
jgi:predicted RNase H-like HicB family nuclease